MPTFRSIVNQLIQPVHQWSKGAPPLANRAFADAPEYQYGSSTLEFRGTPEQRAMAAEASTWVMACIEYRVNAILDTEWDILDKNGVPIEEHPFINAYLWSWLSLQQDLFTRWMTMRLVHGEVYIEKMTQVDKDTPGGLLILNSQNMRKETINGRLLYYVYSVGGHEYRYEIDEIFFDCIPNLRSDIRGKSPMDRAMQEVNIDRFNRETVKRYLLGDNKPGAVMTLRQGAEPLPQETMDRALADWKGQGEGLRGGYTTRILNGPFELNSFGNEPPSGGQSEESQRIICTEFGIDMGLINAASVKDPLGAHTTFRAKQALVATNKIKPDLRNLEQFINYVIMPWIAPDVEGEFKFNRDKIDAIINQTQDNVQMHRNDMLNGGMTVNEYREFRGKETIEGGDIFLIPVGKVVVSQENYQAYVDAQEASFLDAPEEDDSLTDEVGRLSGNVPESVPEPDNEDMIDEAEEKAAKMHDPVPSNGRLSEGEAYVSLPFGENEALRSLYDELVSAHPEIDWQVPDLYHITLVYCNDVDDKILEQIIEEIRPVELSLRTTAFGILINPEGNYVIHLMVERNEQLVEFQRQVYNRFAERDLDMSEFSLPADWYPHITLAFTDTVPPERFVDEENQSHQLEVNEYLINRDGYIFYTAIAMKSVVKELKQWERFALRKPEKALKFIHDAIDTATAFQIRMELDKIDITDKGAVKAIFSTVRDAHESGAETNHIFSGKMARVTPSAIAGALDYFEEIGAEDMLDQFNTMIGAVNDEQDDLQQ